MIFSSSYQKFCQLLNPIVKYQNHSDYSRSHGDRVQIPNRRVSFYVLCVFFASIEREQEVILVSARGNDRYIYHRGAKLLANKCTRAKRFESLESIESF